MSAASLDASDVSGADRTLGPAACRDEDFPGCESFPLPASGLDRPAISRSFLRRLMTRVTKTP